MEELIVSIVSLIVLIPIIYFLPIGLTKKGKALVILAAFIFANLGILAKNSIPLWQTGLLIVLLTFLTVFIIDRRFNKYMFSSGLGENKEIPEMALESLVEQDSFVDITEVEAKEGISLEKLNGVERKPKSIESEIVPLVQEEESEIEELSFDLNEPEQQEEIVEAAPQIEEEDFELDVTFLEDRDSLVEDLEVSYDNEESLSEGYMSEIEQLLENEEMEEETSSHEEDSITTPDGIEDEPILSSDSEHTIILNDEIDIIPFEVTESELEHASEEYLENDSPLEQMELLEDDLDLESELEIIDFEKMDKSEIAEEVEVDNIKSSGDWLLTDDLDLEDLLLEENAQKEVAATLMDETDEEVEDMFEPKLEKPAPLEETPDEPSFEEPIFSILEEEVPQGIEPEMDQIQDVIEESSADSDVEPLDIWKREQKSILQQQLFHTMISQLQLARKQLSPAQYEELIKEHMHPELSAQDTYTFASLLIEHYISQKELDKLWELLTSLDGKFVNYPILDKEIHYLYEEYCK